jgi:hypothetical protein
MLVKMPEGSHINSEKVVAIYTDEDEVSVDCGGDDVYGFTPEDCRKKGYTQMTLQQLADHIADLLNRKEAE